MFKTICLRLVMSFFILSVSFQVSRADEMKGPKWYDTIAVSGFVDGYYSYNFNGPQNTPGGPTRLNFYRGFDPRSNEFALSLAEVNLVKAATDKDRIGTHITLGLGQTADIICGASALSPACSNAGERPYKNVLQGYITMVLVPGLNADLGKFYTPLGAEVVESNQNWNYSRSLLFTWAIPIYHSGARVTYTLNDMFSVMGQINNGWNNVTENNNGKTYGIEFNITPIKTLPIVLNYMTGPENLPGTFVSDTRWIFDAVATWNATDALAFMANYDYGAQKQGLGLGAGDAKWSGFALYGRYAFMSSWAVALRLEQLQDSNNFLLNGGLPLPAAAGGGTSQNVSEGTLTLETSAGTGCVVRLEYRHDQTDASNGIFAKEDGTLSKNQDTLTLGYVHGF